MYHNFCSYLLSTWTFPAYPQKRFHLSDMRLLHWGGCTPWHALRNATETHGSVLAYEEASAKLLEQARLKRVADNLVSQAENSWDLSNSLTEIEIFPSPLSLQLPSEPKSK
ncbi:hypothetical protein AVEN_181241-1 [Araneus ventricosus]|uniref:Uncharacterized protein n=1 Tax=Araneus ventricosus TaxID=182803 RepID=A0A4Y2K5D5_ARAVE|nr:hypothetical protein AVEN_181241-1 [Araneus ventricosus]